MFAFQKCTKKLVSEVPKRKTEISFKVIRGRELQHLDGTVQVYSSALQDQAEIPACLASAMSPTLPCSEVRTRPQSSWFNLVDTRRKTVHSKPPVSPDMYRSLYKKDYPWCKQYKPPNKEDMQKLQIADSQLKAKEFAVPREERAMIYSDSVVGERRPVVPAPSRKASSRATDAGGREAEGSASSPQALQQRKRFTSALPGAESYLPKYYSATKLAATQAEKSERLQALAERENEPSYCQRLPAAAQTAGAAGMFLRRQKLAPGWVTYQQFTQEMYQARQHDAQHNRNMILGSSVFGEECIDFDWRSTYKTDFQRWPGAYGGYCRANKSLSHIFPEDEHLNQNRWVSEYKDSYSISLQRLNWSSQIPAVGLYSGLSPRKRIAMDTAQ